MLKGKVLNKNSVIGIIAPASPEKYSAIKDNLNLFKCLCYKNIIIGNHTINNSCDCDYLAGTDKERADDINYMFSNNSIDGIICLRGGYGCLRTLKYIDDDIIKSHPKFFCGFSDVTLLLNHFKDLGLIGFHGPMINSNLSDIDTIESLNAISNCNIQNYEYDLCKYNDLIFINDNSFSGQIIGGNLATICSAIATPYSIKPNNSILFLEEVNEEPYVIDRMLTQLLLTHFFNSCNGIIVGHVNKSKFYDLKSKKELQDVFINRLKHLHIPLIIGFPFGHDYPNITIPIGCNAHYSSCNKKLLMDENFLI